MMMWSYHDLEPDLESNWIASITPPSQHSYMRKSDAVRLHSFNSRVPPGTH